MSQRQNTPAKSTQPRTRSIVIRSAAAPEASGSRLPTLHTSGLEFITRASTRHGTGGRLERPPVATGPSSHRVHPMATASALSSSPTIPDNDEPAEPEAIQYIWELLRTTNEEVDGLIRDNDAVTQNLERVRSEVANLRERLQIQVEASKRMEAFLGLWVRVERDEGNHGDVVPTRQDEEVAAEKTPGADGDENGVLEEEAEEEAEEEGADPEENRKRKDKGEGKQGDDTDSSSEEEIDELDEEEETDGPKKWVELNPSYDKISYGKKIEEKGTKKEKEQEQEEQELSDYIEDDENDKPYMPRPSQDREEDDEQAREDRESVDDSDDKSVHVGTKRGRNEDEDDEAPTPKRARMGEPWPASLPVRPPIINRQLFATAVLPSRTYAPPPGSSWGQPVFGGPPMDPRIDVANPATFRLREVQKATSQESTQSTAQPTSLSLSGLVVQPGTGAGGFTRPSAGPYPQPSRSAVDLRATDPRRRPIVPTLATTPAPAPVKPPQADPSTATGHPQAGPSTSAGHHQVFGTVPADVERGFRALRRGERSLSVGESVASS